MAVATPPLLFLQLSDVTLLPRHKSITTIPHFSHPSFLHRRCTRTIRGHICPPIHVTTPSTSLSSSATPDEDREQREDNSPSSFSWRDHWYAVSLIEDLDPTVPTPFQLLNRDLVIWKDQSSSKWIALDDRCPHRLAPLSEGRIDESGWIQCSYHGWSFDGEGKCRNIPQASNDGPEASAVNSQRACTIKLPTLVSQGLLFVWPDENGWELAASTQPPLLPDDFNDPNFSTVTIQRDLFYGYDTLMENVSDPSHINFAHHKVTGRRDRAKPLPFKMTSSGRHGFSAIDDGSPSITSEFIAPCYNTNRIEIDARLPLFRDQKWVIWICSFNIPMAPGKTRSIVCSARNFFQFTVPGQAWWQVVPRWYEHLTSNLVYDGDMIVLQGQEKVLNSKSMEEDSIDVNQQYTKITFTPTQSDRLVLAFRNWFRKHGNSQPYWFGATNQQPLPSTVLSKRQMLDRYDQHTLKCSSCKTAYTAFQTWEKIFIGVTVLLCASVGLPSEIGIRLLLSAAAVFSASMAYLSHEFQKKFVFVDYVHSEID